jgi:hypothetical protein
LVYFECGLCSVQPRDWCMHAATITKGSPVHVAPACVGSGEGSDHFGSDVRSHFLHFCKSLFLGLAHDLMVTWQQLYRCTRTPLHAAIIIITFYLPCCLRYGYVNLKAQCLSFCFSFLCISILLGKSISLETVSLRTGIFSFYHSS